MKLEHITDLPVIEASRFILRPARMSDAGLVNLYSSDERVARATKSIPHPLPPGATEAFLAQAMSDARSEDVWILDGSATGLAEVLGAISLQPLDRGQSEIGYWIAPAFWKTGLASEAVAALIAANPHQNCQIFAEVFQDNPGSARVLTNAGFVYLGDAETFSVARGAPVKTWTYSLTLQAT